MVLMIDAPWSCIGERHYGASTHLAPGTTMGLATVGPTGATLYLPQRCREVVLHRIDLRGPAGEPESLFLCRDHRANIPALPPLGRRFRISQIVPLFRDDVKGTGFSF